MKPMKRLGLIILMIISGQTVPLAAQHWPALDAVVYNNLTDRYYFFFGKYFVIKERGQFIDGLPLLIEDEWEGFPKSWHGGGLDAVCYSSDNDSYYFFKGDEYCEKYAFSPTSNPLAFAGKSPLMSKPMKFSDKNSGFKGIPWSRIDAAVYNSITQTYYFFNGNEYVSKKRGEPVNGTVQKVSDAGGFANLAADRPIKAVTFSADNKDYYFFWDEFYMTKELGKTIKAGTAPRKYAGDGQKGFEWAERSNDNYIGLGNEAGYLANFKVTWSTGGKEDSWKKKATALSYEKRLKLPKNATDITIEAYTYDALKDGNGEKIFSESMSIPPNKWYKVYGTVFKPQYKVDSKPSNITGNISTFFTRDVVKGWEEAASFIEDNVQDAQYETAKALAKSDFEAKRDFILKFGDAASKVIKDKTFIESLFRAAKGKNPSVAADVMKQLVKRPEFESVFRMAAQFKSLSVGFTSGASTIIGVEGCYGYGVSLDATKVKGYAGLDASLGVQEGLGLGCQFGIWTDPPDKLDGTSIAANVEAGSGVGVSFSIVYNVSLGVDDVPKLSFAGVVVTPGIGAGVGASVGSGYSWVF